MPPRATRSRCCRLIRLRITWTNACYRVKPSKGAAKFPKDLRAKVVDQFDQEKLYDLKYATWLCTPTDVSGGEVKDETKSLMCYQVLQARGICTENAPSNANGVCKKEADCGGTREVTSFCDFQPKQQRVLGIHVNNEFLPELVDTTRTEEVCLPSEVE